MKNKKIENIKISDRYLYTIGKGKDKVHFFIYRNPFEIWIEVGIFHPAIVCSARMDGIKILRDDIGNKRDHYIEFVPIDWVSSKILENSELHQTLIKRKNIINDQAKKYWTELI
jgi:hypothetical protein